MLRIAGAVVLCLAAAACASAASDPSIAASAQSESPLRSPEEIEVLEGVVAMFESPTRHEWQKPDLVVELLKVRPGDHVADLGAGTGYFTRLLSEAVGEAGKVYAIDTSQAMVDYLLLRDDMPHDNLEVILAPPDDPKLPAGKIELVLLVNTWQYIDPREVYLQKLARALAPSSGRVAVVDWKAGDRPKGPISALPRVEAIAEFKAAGWKLVSESDALPYQYFLIVAPPPGDRRSAAGSSR